MSLQGEQLSAPPPTDHEIEQLLLGLADGSYVLSTPDGAVAECGIGAGALLGAAPEELAGHPVPDVLASAADPAQRAAFEQLLHGHAHAADQRFAAMCADGSTRSLRCLVVSVPLALGWEFTSLLSELGSRDADSWQLDELRMRHERALEAVQAVCKTGVQPDSGGRLAGILVVISDCDAPPLTREGVGERMQRHREAVREAKEAARRLELGLDDAPGDVAGDAGGLEDLVERAQMLRARLEEAELQATEALVERDRVQEQLDTLRDERDADAGRLTAEHERALAQLAAERAERQRAIASLEAQHAHALARLADVEAERDLEAQRRAAAESHAATTQDGRLRELASERDRARGEAQTAHTAAQQAREAADAARADGQRALAELQALRDSILAEQESSVSADAELQALRAELQAGHGAAEAAAQEQRAAQADAVTARGEHALARGELAALRGELETTRGTLDATRGELETASSALDATRAELAATRAAAEELRTERERALQRADELRGEADRARAAADAIRAEFAFEPPATAAPGSKTLRNPFAPPPKPLRQRPAHSVQQASTEPAPDLPACEPGVAAALIGLDGTFKRLDDAFCSLLGCDEDELRNARWPSIIDRENLKAHQEIARALGAGEILSADIETVYMHKRGLLVPVDGTVSMLRDGAGHATHFLFRADVRRTSGAPA